MAGDESVTGWVATAPFDELLDIRLLEAAKGRARLGMPFAARLAQGEGLLHGGAIVSLGDSAAALAIKSVLEPGARFGTVRLETDIFRPVKAGRLTAEAAISRVEGRTIHVCAVIRDDKRHKVAEVRTRFKVAKDAVVHVDELEPTPPGAAIA